ncbi:hypothetical protein CTI14_65245, partial [Methylobacterium radiotolerans]
TVQTAQEAAVASRARIPNAQITATASSEETAGEDGTAANMLDGNAGPPISSTATCDRADRAGGGCGLPCPHPERADHRDRELRGDRG